MMDEARARKILAKAIKPDNALYNRSLYLSWKPDAHMATLDADFTAEELQAIAWWMEHMKLPERKR